MKKTRLLSNIYLNTGFFLIILLPFFCFSYAISLPLSDYILRGDQYFLSYHKDFANLKKALEQYEKATNESDAEIAYEAYWKISNVYMTMGDLEDEKAKRIDLYKLGKNAAWAGIKLNPGKADNHFWYFANLGKVSKLKGKISLLFALSEMKKHVNLALESDPNFIYAVNGQAILLQDIPRYLGGDIKKSESLFKKAIELDPNLSSPYWHLATLYEEEGREEEAIIQLNKLINLKKPTWYPNWEIKYKPWAEKLLDELKKKVTIQ